MSYRDIRDFEPEYTVTMPGKFESEPDVLIEIEKLGGGTIGKYYTGIWRYRVSTPSGLLEYGQDLDTGPIPHSHEMAASALALHLSALWGETASACVGNFTESVMDLARRLDDWGYARIHESAMNSMK